VRVRIANPAGKQGVPPIQAVLRESLIANLCRRVVEAEQQGGQLASRHAKNL